MDAQPDMAVDRVGVRGEEVMCIRSEAGDRQQLDPLGRLVRIFRRMTGFYRAGARIIAGEVRRVDVEAGNPPFRGERDNRVVVAGAAAAAGFPAVHPFAVIVVKAGVECGRFVL